MNLTESIVDNASIEWFREPEYAAGHGSHLAPGDRAAEREEDSKGAQRRPSREARFPFGSRVVPRAAEVLGSPRAAGTGGRLPDEEGTLGQCTLFTGGVLEGAAMERFGPGPRMASSEPAAERDSFGEVVLVERLREAIRGLNPAIPEEAREEALRGGVPPFHPDILN